MNFVAVRQGFWRCTTLRHESFEGPKMIDSEVYNKNSEANGSEARRCEIHSCFRRWCNNHNTREVISGDIINWK